MASKIYDEDSIRNIAIAIRSVDGSEDTYTVSEMADAVVRAAGATLTVEETDEGVKFTATDKNGTTTATMKSHVDGLDEKLPINQGAANVGKILVVGTDGNLTLTDMPEGGASGDVIGTLDESNNILLTGNLADGTYTLKYENADGTYTEIGTLEVGAIPEPEPEPTNFFVIGGDGYLNPGRASSNGSDRTDVALCLLSNYINVQNGDEVYVYGANSSNENVSLMALYTESTGVGFYVRNNTTYITNVSMSDEVDVFTINYADVTRMRVCCLIPSDLNTIKVNIKRNGEWL